eukprot:scaffold25246_cov69-Phaeocystis_antarctica.AAC.1
MSSMRRRRSRVEPTGEQQFLRSAGLSGGSVQGAQPLSELCRHGRRFSVQSVMPGETRAMRPLCTTCASLCECC